MGLENEIGRLGSVLGAAAVDLSTTDYLPSGFTPRGIYIGGAGDVKADLVNGDTVTFTALAAGVEHAIAVKKIYKTGTTATGILVLK